MNKMKSITINGQKFRVVDDGAIRYDEAQGLDPKQKLQAQENIGIDEWEDPGYSVYFDIDADGLVSLKDEYRGCPTNNDYDYAVSNNGVGVDGSKNAELPEVLIIPDVINDIAVSALVEGMFCSNHRVKSLTIPQCVTTLPRKFADFAINLAELKGAENVEVIGQAAFQGCGIKKAIFPNLKSFDGVGQFNRAGNLAIADIGNTVTELPQSCFGSCERLSFVRGGSNITTIGKRAFYHTRSLKNLPIVANLKSIGSEAFLNSRVTYDWWTFKDSGYSFSGTDNTPAHFNPTDWWSSCTYTACKTPLGSTFHQRNPEWSGEHIHNSSDTYGEGCTEVSAAHIYSALAGVKMDSPRYFVETIVGGIDNGSLLDPTGGKAGEPSYSFADMERWLTALGLQCELLTYSTANLQKVYDALAEGAMILTYTHPAHASVIYGIADNGEMLILESDATNHNLQDYTARTYQQPIWSFEKSGLPLLIVKKKEDNI